MVRQAHHRWFGGLTTGGSAGSPQVVRRAHHRWFGPSIKLRTGGLATARDMAELIIKTKKAKEVVDITDRVNEFLKNEGVGNGQVHLFLTHTTAALTTADLDPGTDLDMLDALEALIPQHANGAPPPDGSGPDRKSRILDGGRDNANAPMRIKYRHPHDPSHVPDHILSSLIGASLTLPVRGGALILGTWQRIVLIEFSGPRERRIVVSLL